MFQKIQKGDVSGFKGKIGPSDIPREALPFLNGFKVEGMQIIVEALKDTYEIDTSELNPLEMACVYGHSKLVTYLLDE